MKGDDKKFFSKLNNKFDKVLGNNTTIEQRRKEIDDFLDSLNIGDFMYLMNRMQELFKKWGLAKE